MIRNWQIGNLIQHRWEIYRILKGGMGVVYIVYDHEFHEALAAKSFQDEIFACDPSIAQRFTQEARTWVNLDAHQNVTEARAVQNVEGKPYLFLEYVSGGDLGAWIPRLAKDLPQALRFAIQFCDGMSHVCAKGIKAHRDIKPQNCLVTADKILKITDFGLAKVFDEAEQESGEHLKRSSIGLTATGIAAGTPSYMAPEQFDDAKHVNVRADIYSFGVMLFQMLTGQLPFNGRTWQELEQLHKGQPVPPLGGQSRYLSQIIQRCLAKDSADRYMDFRNVRQELTAVYERLTGEAAPRPVVGAELNASQWGNKGVSLAELGRHEEAVACYQRVLEINSLNEVAWTNKGNALYSLGRHLEALTCYDEAIAIKPSFEGAWVNKGNVLCIVGRSQEAIDCFDQALNSTGSGTFLTSVTWNGKGTALRQLGKSREAVECFDAAIKLDEQSALAWCNKALALTEVGNFQEAYVCSEKALTLNPKQAEAWFAKGQSAAQFQRHEEAVDCYAMAVTINPALSWAWYGKGMSLAQLGRYEEAAEPFRKFIEVAPTNNADSVRQARDFVQGFDRWKLARTPTSVGPSAAESLG